MPAKGIPGIADLSGDPDQRALLRYGASAPNQFGKVYLLPPGTPDKTAAVLEAALQRNLTDRGFLADAAKSRLEITPTFGAAIHSIVKDFLNMPPATRERLRAVIRK